MTAEIYVIKLNIKQRVIWRYKGSLLIRKPNMILLEAVFDRPDIDLHFNTIKTGDIFQELYYTNHWYNIFRILDKQDRHVKYWYCNVACPAVFTGTQIRYIDLALDLLILPDGSSIELDWDEFNNLDLPQITRQKAIKGLDQLKQIAKNGDHLKLFKIVS